MWHFTLPLPASVEQIFFPAVSEIRNPKAIQIPCLMIFFRIEKAILGIPPVLTNPDFDESWGARGVNGVPHLEKMTNDLNNLNDLNGCPILGNVHVLELYPNVLISFMAISWLYMVINYIYNYCDSNINHNIPIIFLVRHPCSSIQVH
jgi:hypothetical protein